MISRILASMVVVAILVMLMGLAVYDTSVLHKAPTWAINMCWAVVSAVVYYLFKKAGN